MSARLRSPLLLAGLTLVAAFAAGTVTGVAVERVRTPEPTAPLRPPGEGRPPIFAADGPLAARLELSDAQRDSVRSILVRERARADTLYGEFRPRLRARMDSSTAAVESVLTPEQRAEWHRIRAERRGRWRHGEPGPRSGERRGPRGMGPPP
jgi:hypothetical protein